MAKQNETISANEALGIARQRGCFCRVTAGGRGLAFYTGDELAAGTWMEIGRTGMTDNGQISRNAFDYITNTHKAA